MKQVLISRNKMDDAWPSVPEFPFFLAFFRISFEPRSVAYKTRNYVKYLDTVVRQASSSEKGVYHQVLYRAFQEQSRSPLSFLRVHFLSRSIYEKYENCRVDLVPCLYSSIHAMEEKKEEKGERIEDLLPIGHRWKKEKEELESHGSSRKKEFPWKWKRNKMLGNEQLSSIEAKYKKKKKKIKGKKSNLY